MNSIRLEPMKEDHRMIFHRLVWPRLLLSSLLWCVLYFCYIGLTLFQTPQFFPENPNLDWCFGFLLEIPAYALALYLIEVPCLGRKFVGGGSTTIGGIVMLVLVLEVTMSEDQL